MGILGQYMEHDVASLERSQGCCEGTITNIKARVLPVRAQSSKRLFIRKMASLVVLLGLAGGLSYLIITFARSSFQLAPLYKNHDAFPGSLSKAFDAQALDEIAFKRKSDGHYDLKLLAKGKVLYTLENVDLRLFLPRLRLQDEYSNIDNLVSWSQEYHRAELKFWIQESNVIVALANNCLSAGHWEVALRTYDVSGYEVDMYHGAFTIPAARYVRFLWEYNGWVNPKRLLSLWTPPPKTAERLDVTSLRKVNAEREIDARTVNQNLNEATQTFMEQRRKRKLTRGQPATLEDLYHSDIGIALTEFVTPGIYNLQRKKRFDYRYLKNPKTIICRNVKSLVTGKDNLEVVVEFNNGWRLFIGGLNHAVFDHAVLPERLAPSALIKLGFGVMTRESTGWYKDRFRDQEEFGETMVLMMDDSSKVLGHHALGLDEIWLEVIEGKTSTLEIRVLGYERELAVSHWSIPIPEDFIRPPGYSLSTLSRKRVYWHFDRKHLPDKE